MPLSSIVRIRHASNLRGERSGKFPILRMNNLHSGRIVIDDLQYDLEENDFSQFKLNRNDILFNRTNSIEWVGKSSNTQLNQ